MANALVIYDGPGPLPVSATFQAPSDGSVIFVLSGTARTSSAAILLGIYLNLDGNSIGNASLCWFNQNDVHMALRPTFIPYSGLSFGEHTITIEPADSATITDVNDYFQVTLIY